MMQSFIERQKVFFALIGGFVFLLELCSVVSVYGKSQNVRRKSKRTFLHADLWKARKAAQAIKKAEKKEASKKRKKNRAVKKAEKRTAIKAGIRAKTEHKRLKVRYACLPDLMGAEHLEKTIKKAEREALQLRLQARNSMFALETKVKHTLQGIDKTLHVQCRHIQEQAKEQQVKANDRAEQQKHKALCVTMQSMLDAKYAAEHEALNIEKMALQRTYGIEQRDQALEVFIEREELLKEFDNDIAYLQQVIEEGEADADYRRDFMMLFEEQKSWFTRTLESVHQETEELYKRLLKKKDAIHALRHAHERACIILTDRGGVLTEDMRLRLLYDLNAMDGAEFTPGALETVVMNNLLRTEKKPVAETLVPEEQTEVEQNVRVLEEEKAVQDLSQELAVKRFDEERELFEEERKEQQQQLETFKEQVQEDMHQMRKHYEEEVRASSLEAEIASGRLKEFQKNFNNIEKNS